MTCFCSYAHGSPLLENSSAFKTQKVAEKPSAALGTILMLDFVIRNEDRLPRRLVVEQKKPYEIILISRGMSPSYAKGETLWIPLAKSDDDDAMMTSVQKHLHALSMMGDTIAGGSPSLLYNENILIKSLRTMVCTMTKPQHFEPFVPGHFRNSAQDILMACYSYKLLEKAFNKLEAKEVEGFLHQIETSSPPPASAATPVVDEDLYAAVVRKMKVVFDGCKRLCVHYDSANQKCLGIRVESTNPCQITMDMDFRWGGDPDIVLGIAAAGVSLPIQAGHVLDIDWQNNRTFASSSVDGVIYVCKIGEDQPIRAFPHTVCNILI
ncbi:dual specificity protein phosphatase PHS1-like protein isoform X1 [Tanacetum coccineum]